MAAAAKRKGARAPDGKSKPIKIDVFQPDHWVEVALRQPPHVATVDPLEQLWIYVLSAADLTLRLEVYAQDGNDWWHRRHAGAAGFLDWEPSGKPGWVGVLDEWGGIMLFVSPVQLDAHALGLLPTQPPHVWGSDWHQPIDPVTTKHAEVDHIYRVTERIAHEYDRLCDELLRWSAPFDGDTNEQAAEREVRLKRVALAQVLVSLMDPKAAAPEQVPSRKPPDPFRITDNLKRWQKPFEVVVNYLAEERNRRRAADKECLALCTLLYGYEHVLVDQVIKRSPNGGERPTGERVVALPSFRVWCFHWNASSERLPETEVGRQFLKKEHDLALAMPNSFLAEDWPYWGLAGDGNTLALALAARFLLALDAPEFVGRLEKVAAELNIAVEGRRVQLKVGRHQAEVTQLEGRVIARQVVGSLENLLKVVNFALAIRELAALKDIEDGWDTTKRVGAFVGAGLELAAIFTDGAFRRLLYQQAGAHFGIWAGAAALVLAGHGFFKAVKAGNVDYAIGQAITAGGAVLTILGGASVAFGVGTFGVGFLLWGAVAGVIGGLISLFGEDRKNEYEELAAHCEWGKQFGQDDPRRVSTEGSFKLWSEGDEDTRLTRQLRSVDRLLSGFIIEVERGRPNSVLLSVRNANAESRIEVTFVGRYPAANGRLNDYTVRFQLSPASREITYLEGSAVTEDADLALAPLVAMFDDSDADAFAGRHVVGFTGKAGSGLEDANIYQSRAEVRLDVNGDGKVKIPHDAARWAEIVKEREIAPKKVHSG